jgi:prepilin-type N-terminal cleavage/methylation domain-containing protein
MKKSAFTLIEVLVSIVIITIVAGALLQIFNDNSKFFEKFTENKEINILSTILIKPEKIVIEKSIKDIAPIKNIDNTTNTEISNTDITDNSESNNSAKYIVQNSEQININGESKVRINFNDYFVDDDFIRKVSGTKIDIKNEPFYQFNGADVSQLASSSTPVSENNDQDSPDAPKPKDNLDLTSIHVDVYKENLNFNNKKVYFYRLNGE